MNVEYDSVLSKIENIEEPFYERDVGTLIRKLRGEEDASKLPMPWLAEYIAFDFYENNSEDGSIWGTYFGPMWSGTNEDGTAFESPSIRMVTSEILDYWEDRAKQVKHPILKARYSALVWDFSNKVLGRSGPIEMAHIWIDSIIQIAETDCHKYESDVIGKLKKILSLAISINAADKVEKIKNAIIMYESKITLNGKKGRWGFSFDNLLMNKKVSLSDDEQNQILNALEKRLTTVSDISNTDCLDPFAAEKAAIRLAQYYRKQNNAEDVKRVLLKYGNTFEHVSKDASGSLAIAWLQKVEAVYRDFGLKHESDRILNIIRDRGPDAQKDMFSIPIEQKISRDEMDNFVNQMTEGDIDETITRIAIRFIPRKDAIVKQMKKIAQSNPLYFDMPIVIQDRKGRKVAHVDSLENDLNGRLIMQMSQNIKSLSIFLRQTIRGLQTKFSVTSDLMLKKFYESPAFNSEKSVIIKRGLDAYWRGDHLVAIHLLIPQIEDAIRRLLELTGGTTYKHARNGWYQLKTFGEMLQDDVLTNIFGEDVILYIQLLYTDPRGWNLRNNVCHGISLPNEFGIEISDRVFHTLLLLSQIKQKNGGK